MKLFSCRMGVIQQNAMRWPLAPPAVDRAAERRGSERFGSVPAGIRV